MFFGEIGSLVKVSSKSFEYSGAGTRASPFIGKSKNKDHGSTGSLQFKMTAAGDVTVESSVSSENNYDFAHISVNGQEKWQKSGSGSYGTTTFTLQKDATIQFKFSKDSSAHGGNDEQTFSLSATTTSGCRPCPAGTFGLSGKECTPCPSGKTSPPGSTSHSSCI